MHLAYRGPIRVLLLLFIVLLLIVFLFVVPLLSIIIARAFLRRASLLRRVRRCGAIRSVAIPYLCVCSVYSRLVTLPSKLRSKGDFLLLLF